MKKIFLIGIVLVFAANFSLDAQQLSLQSQYMINDFVLNPALAGSKNYIPVNLNVRRQWVGIEGAPITQSLSAHGYIGKNVGLGGYYFNDVTGPSRRTGVNLSFAYHLKLNQDYTKKLSFGLSGVFFQHVINKDMLTTDLPDDPAILNVYNNQLVPDANFGISYTHEKTWYAGVSVFNLLQVKKNLFQMMDDIENPIERTYYANVGGYIHAGEKITFQPSVLFRYQQNTPFQFDVGSLIIFKDLFWIGGSYRHEDAAVAMAGIRFDKFRLGYAYDITLSEVKDYAPGSHEINLVYYIFTNKVGNYRGSYSPMFN